MTESQEQPTRVAIYIRVSTQEQAEEGYSLAAQQGALTEFCEKSTKPKRVVAGVYADEGKSGSAIKGRAALQRMLADAQAGKFDEVLVYKLNRLARKAKDASHIVEVVLEGCHVVFRSLKEPQYDTTTALGKFQFHVMAAVAEYERDNIVENVRFGMRQRAKEGRWNGRVPLGYESVDKLLEIVPDEAQLVREIFLLAADGKGLWAIANHLNQRGKHTHLGNPFSPFAISSILHNPVYVGKVRFNVRDTVRKKRNPDEQIILVDGPHQPIIDKGMWDTVQAIRAARAGKPRHFCERGFPLTGLLRCPSCGTGMVMSRTQLKQKDGSYRLLYYYSCGRSRQMGKSVCKWNGVRAEAIERAVFQRLSDTVAQERVIRDVVATVNAQRKAEVGPLRQRRIDLEKEIRKHETARDRYLRDYERGKMPGHLVTARVAELDLAIVRNREEANILQTRLEGAHDEPVSTEAVRRVLRRFVTLMARASADQKRALLHLLVEKITLTDARDLGTIAIHLHADLLKVLQEEVTALPGDVRATV